MWLSLVERYVRDVEVASSNLVTSTKKHRRDFIPAVFFITVLIFQTCSARHCASSHTPSEVRQARLSGAGRGYHGAKRSYLVTLIVSGIKSRRCFLSRCSFFKLAVPGTVQVRIPTADADAVFIKHFYNQKVFIRYCLKAVLSKSTQYLLPNCTDSEFKFRRFSF